MPLQAVGSSQKLKRINHVNQYWCYTYITVRFSGNSNSGAGNNVKRHISNMAGAEVRAQP